MTRTTKLLLTAPARSRSALAAFAGVSLAGGGWGRITATAITAAPASLFEAFDANQDGTLTQAEIDQARQAKLTEFDRDGDGSLTLEEYQALWMDAMRERMVDRFQAHDDDGDGMVTAEEFGERLQPDHQPARPGRRRRGHDGRDARTATRSDRDRAIAATTRATRRAVPADATRRRAGRVAASREHVLLPQPSQR